MIQDMKNPRIKTLMAAAVLLATGCTSYEIDMPENPEAPVVGNEVSTNVVYEANPRLFAENECLKALTAQLPRISEMGCDILWVMPVYEPGALNSIGSPYCIRDFESLNPKYGTMDDLKALVSAAHAKGMKVMFDWIANHTAWDHPWISEHPDRYQHDGEGNIVSPNGWSDVAQLDFNNPETRDAMTSSMVYWLREADIDGYRCDFADGVPEIFWTSTIEALRAIDPEFIMLAETSDYGFYNYGFDMIYDWGSSTAIASAFTGGKPSGVVTEAEDALVKVPDGKSILRYVFNHDTAADNAIDRMLGSTEAIPAAYVLASMLNGTPMIYSAMDAEGVRGQISFFNYNPLNFSTELTKVYRSINDAFKSTGELRRGELRDFSTSSVVCFTRSIPDHTLLVAVNTTGDVKTVKSPIELAGSSMTNVIDGTSANVPVVLELEPYSYIILKN